MSAEWGSAECPSCRRSTLVLPFGLRWFGRRGAPQNSALKRLGASMAVFHPGRAAAFCPTSIRRGGPGADENGSGTNDFSSFRFQTLRRVEWMTGARKG